MVWDIPLISWDQLSWLYPLPDTCPPPAYLPGGAEQETEKAFMLSSMVQQNIRNSKYKKYNKSEKKYTDETKLLKKILYS